MSCKFIRLITVIITAGLLALGQPAFAQKAGPNGGKLAGKDGHETELVLSPTEITIYLIDNGKVEPTKGAVVQAVMQVAGATTTVQLVDADGKKLIGKLASPLTSGAIVVISGKDHHGHAISSRYVIE